MAMIIKPTADLYSEPQQITWFNQQNQKYEIFTSECMICMTYQEYLAYNSNKEISNWGRTNNIKYGMYSSANDIYIFFENEIDATLFRLAF